MTTPIDRAVVAHVAHLASLSLGDAEEERLTKELAAILAYVAELSSVDTSDVPATSQVRLGEGDSAGRSDEILPGLGHDEALSQAPRVSQGGFAVPGFVESEE